MYIWYCLHTENSMYNFFMTKRNLKESETVLLRSMVECRYPKQCWLQSYIHQSLPTHKKFHLRNSYCSKVPQITYYNTGCSSKGYSPLLIFTSSSRLHGISKFRLGFCSFWQHKSVCNSVRPLGLGWALPFGVLQVCSLLQFTLGVQNIFSHDDTTGETSALGMVLKRAFVNTWVCHEQFYQYSVTHIAIRN